MTPEEKFKRNQYQKEWNRKNPERHKEIAAKTRAKHRDKNAAYLRFLYRKNKPLRLAQSRFYRLTHKEQIKQSHHDYYIKNKEKHKKAARAWRLKNKEKVRIYRRKHRLNNREFYRHREHLRREKIRKSTKEESDAIKTWDRAWRLADFVFCHWCKNEFEPKDCQSDHVVPLSKGGRHSRENMVIACEKCNHRKYNMMPDKWVEKLNAPMKI